MSKLIVEQLNITQVTGRLVNLTFTRHPRLVKLIEMLKLNIEDVSVALKTIKVLWNAKCLEKEHLILIGVVDKKGIIHTVMLESDDPVEFYGNWYGYPKCCIDEFKVRSIKGKEANVFDGTGYVACPECRKKDPSEIVEHITNNRLAPLPFGLSNNPISEILDVIMHYNFNDEMQEKHKEINKS